MRKILLLLVLFIFSLLTNCGRRKNPLEPEFVTLIFPENDQVVTTTEPTFIWNHLSYAYKYELQIDDRNTFYTPIVDDSNITSSPYHCPVSLSDRRYWWRVRTKQKYSGWEVWSETGTFIVSIGTPTLISPVDDTVKTNTPTFTWSPIPYALKYRIEIDEYSTFYTPIIDDSSLTTEEYISDTTLIDGLYYWRVKVQMDDKKWSKWSNIVNFQIDTNPFRLVSTVQTTGYAKDVLIQNDTAYVAQGEGGLAIIDLTDEENPFLISECNAHGNARGIAIMDSFAYLTVGKNGVSSILFSDPEAPEWIYQVAGGEDNAEDILIYSPTSDTLSYIFVAEKDEGMWVLEIFPEYPGYPQPMFLFDVPGYENGLSLNSIYLYIACGELGLTIVDINKITQPEIVGTCDTKGYAYDVFVKDTLVFIADGREGLEIISAADVSSPYILGSYDTDDNARGVFVKGDTAFIADENNGLVVLNVSNPTSPQYLGGVETEYANALWVEQDYAVIADKYEGIIVVKWNGN